MKAALRQVSDLPQGLARYTWEQRRKMTAKELTQAMGALHVNHPQFKARPRTLLPMPNLANVQPTIECHDATFIGMVRALIGWVLK